jgi:hypothetical protein
VEISTPHPSPLVENRNLIKTVELKFSGIKKDGKLLYSI